MQQNELLKTVLNGTLREKLLSHLQRKKGLLFFIMKYRSGYCIQLIWEILPIVGNGFPLLERIFNTDCGFIVIFAPDLSLHW